MHIQHLTYGPHHSRILTNRDLSTREKPLSRIRMAKSLNVMSRPDPAQVAAGQVDANPAIVATVPEHDEEALAITIVSGDTIGGSASGGASGTPASCEPPIIGGSVAGRDPHPHPGQGEIFTFSDGSALGVEVVVAKFSALPDDGVVVSIGDGEVTVHRAVTTTLPDRTCISFADIVTGSRSGKP